MIVFELICERRHRFEGWFSRGDDFADQQRSGLLSCPSCGSASVEKLPTAKVRKAEAPPAHAAGRREQGLPARPTPKDLNELIDYVLLNTEDVGNRFPEEARRIHREEAPRRDIRGVATPQEAQDLLEEGVPVLPLPVPPRGERH